MEKAVISVVATQIWKAESDEKSARETFVSSARDLIEKLERGIAQAEGRDESPSALTLPWIAQNTVARDAERLMQISERKRDADKLADAFGGVEAVFDALRESIESDPPKAA